jgi:hypothetical protein
MSVAIPTRTNEPGTRYFTPRFVNIVVGDNQLEINFRNSASNNSYTIDNLFFWRSLTAMVALDNSTTWITSE